MTNNRQIHGQNYTEIPKIFWRGSLAGAANNIKVKDSICWRLCQLGASHPHLFDAGLVGDPDSISLDEFVPQVEGSLFASRIKMTNFRKHAGVLDVDGNSWSARFAKLLCMDSVILKVELTYVDYFWFKLEPWKHYVPVKANLTDLVELVEWVTANSQERLATLCNE
jgi:hypothetical protein